MEYDYDKVRNNKVGWILTAALAFLTVLPNRRGVRRRKRKRRKPDLPAKEELTYSFALPPGAAIDVSNINGAVFIETADTNIAEVQTICSAHERGDLDQQPIIVEATNTGLSIHTERQISNSFYSKEVRHRVILKLPRKVELSVYRVNGRVDVGEIEGTALLQKINGGVNVSLGQTSGPLEIFRVNGGVQISLAQPQAPAMKIHRVNGGVELHFTGDPNAELEVEGFLGEIDSDVPLTVKGTIGSSRIHARMGSGGPLIAIQRVNGGVRLRQEGHSV